MADGALSLTQAAGIMTGAKEPETPAAPAAQPQPKETPAAPEPQAAAPEQPEAQPTGDELSPEELGEETGTDGQAGQKPSLDPPASFNAQEKEAFRKAPREVQEAMHRLETTRRSSFTKEQNAIREQRSKLDTELRQAQAERQLIAEQIRPLVDSLQAQFQTDFADIKTPADLQRLAEIDPIRFNKWQAQQYALGAAKEQARIHQHQEAEKLRAELAQTVREEKVKLTDVIPAWKAEDAFSKGMDEVKDYLKSYDFDDGIIRQIADHRHVVIARKAMLYDRAIAARNGAKTPAQPSATVKPGTSTTAAESGKQARAAQLDKLNRSGKLEDAVSLLYAR